MSQEVMFSEKGEIFNNNALWVVLNERHSLNELGMLSDQVSVEMSLLNTWNHLPQGED
jgi:hypothetical protein